MNDEKRELLKAAVGLVPTQEVYKDVAQPAAREIGAAFGELGSLARTALRPIRTVRVAWDSIFDRIDGWIEEKLRGAKPQEIVAPPMNIAGGVVTGLVFVEDEPDLRELFLNLLATSMQTSKQSVAHPALAEFIKQMTPLEARIIRHFAFGGVRQLPKIDVRSHDLPPAAPPRISAQEPKPATLLSRMNDDLLLANIERPPSEAWSDEISVTELDNTELFRGERDLLPAFENLERLQLLHMSSELTTPDTMEYVRLARSPRALQFVQQIEGAGRAPGLHPGLITRTALGQQFIKACVDPTIDSQAG